MNQVLRIPIWFLLLLMMGCGCRQPQIARLSQDSIIVAFGDSLTAGSGAETKDSYPAVLETIIGCKVINAGVPGELSSGGVERLPGVLEQYKPALVVLCHGGNDLLSKTDESQTIQNLKSMVETIRGSGADVILVGVPRPALLLKSASFYRDVADQYRIPYDGATLARILSSATLKSDTIHPNAKGYRTLAEALAKLIKRCQPE